MNRAAMVKKTYFCFVLCGGACDFRVVCLVGEVCEDFCWWLVVVRVLIPQSRKTKSKLGTAYIQFA